MGGRDFLLLKAGDSRPESSKQAEIRLAILLKILRIPPASEAGGLAKARRGVPWLYLQRRDMPNSAKRDFCDLDHRSRQEIGAVSCIG